MHIGVRGELSRHATMGLGLDRGGLTDLLLGMGGQGSKTRHQSNGRHNPWVMHWGSFLSTHDTIFELLLPVKPNAYVTVGPGPRTLLRRLEAGDDRRARS